MKRHYSFTYFIGQAFKGLWRNGVMSVASVAVLVCCLVVMGVFSLLVANLNENLNELQLANEIVVFLDYDATEEDASRVEQSIRSLSNMGVGDVTFVSKEEALEEMREQYADRAELFQSIGDGDNPLAYSFIVTVDDVTRGMELQFALENVDPCVRKVNNRMDIAASVDHFKRNITYVFVFFLIILFVVSVFVIINTVRLAVYARRNEILVMRYVGASRLFIITPFLMEGFIIGIVSAVLAFFACFKLYEYIASIFTPSFALISLIEFSVIRTPLFWSFIAVGIFTGIVGSLISLRRRVEV